MTTKIKTLQALEILDSRGRPTVEARVVLENGISARFAVPSGASTGSREAVEKRDKDKNRFGGLGVLKAVAHINNEIAAGVIGQSSEDQEAIDQILISLDNSENKSNYGVNAILAVSVAIKKAAAKALSCPLYRAFNDKKEMVLPVPLMNILNGGVHASNNLDIQEFMIVPYGFDSFTEGLQAGVETFYALRDLLIEKGLSTNVGDEGGFAPNVNGSTAAMDLIMRAIEKAGYQPQHEIGIALDCAASEFYRDEQYHLPADNFIGNSEALVERFNEWKKHYPIISIEDGCDENDWEGWRLLTTRLGHQTQLVGDDLFVTNPKILNKGIKENIANALLVKLNQIGTISETLLAVNMAHEGGYQTIMSHRSGETEYSDIADMAVAMGCWQIKTGAPCRSERTSKYNQLLRIAADIKGEVIYGGKAFSK